ncbi:MAG: hypothetical protein HC932_00300 [Thermales bacterium]|nr:hypothetical protein [Thermales bacterium]
MVFDIPQNPTIKDIHNLYLTSQAKVTQVVEYFFEKIKQKDPNIQAVVRYNENLANQQASKLDNMIVNRTQIEIDDLLQKMPLFGVPYAMKDNVLVEGQLLTAQSRILDGYEATYSADIFEYLTEAGAVLIAQTNMDEFAFGSSTEFSGFGQITKNPWDNSRVAGGTSGGSAALVASGGVPFAIGTDTGGSIRQPSSFCGVVGMRPTYGSVSRYGIVASTSSFDQAGPISNSVEDNELILKVLQKNLQ